MSVAIIGGGASSMILAAKLKNKDVTIFERNSKLGKKLLLTGNGKCNFTNEDFSNLQKIFNNDFAIEIYKKYDKNSCIDFYSSIGIVPKIEIHKGIGYYYPNNNKSTSVYYNLLDKIIDNNVNIIYNTCIIDISYKNNVFTLYDENHKTYIFDKVVIATGGITYKSTGSDGIGYNLAKKLGHSIIEPIPALCGLKSKDGFISDIKNIRVDANASAWLKDNGTLKYIDSEFGEIQITEYGLSGIPIFNLSRNINRLIKENKEIYIYLNFRYKSELDIKKNIELVIKELTDRRKKISYKKTIDFLCGYLPDELGRVIINMSGINKTKLVIDISDDELKLIAKNLVNFKVKIEGYNDINLPQITLGGIKTTEIDSSTLMSKIVKNLYFLGEIIDIDGKCGGYNLQLVYSTASIVANNI